MVSPLLVIGVGGSGGKTIRSMKQALKRQMDAHRYEGGIPSAWQFLQIDTTYDGVDFPAPMLPQDEVHLVVKPGDDFNSVKRQLESIGSVVAERQKLLSGWAIPQSSISIAMGAGQQRAIGRQVGIADAQGIRSALQVAISKMNNPNAMSELQRFADALGQKIDPTEQPKAIIIASLAGGSGAGMFIDVAEILKRSATDNWAKNAIAFLYTSEVFESLGAAGANVRKNSLGAMNEVVAGKWNGLSDRTQSLFDKIGLTSDAGSGDKFGAKGNILIGSRNSSGVNLAQSSDGAGMDEVFMTIGEALAGAYADDRIYEFLYKRAFVNITDTWAVIDKSGLGRIMTNAGPSNFAGIGFGQLSLGTERVVDYVADAMTRKQVQVLLWPELNPELLKDGAKLQTLIDDKEAELWPQFLPKSGMNERGAEDQVINALRPESAESDMKSFVTAVVKTGVAEKPVELPKVAQRIWSEWETRLQPQLDSLDSQMKKNAIIWRETIQDQLVDVVTDYISIHGYQVTNSLLVHLQNEIKDHGIASLKNEIEESSRAIKGFNQSSFNESIKTLSEGRSGLSSNDGAVFNKISAGLMQVVKHQHDIALKQLAVSVMQDFSTNFIAVLIEKLANSRFELSRDQGSKVLQNGQTNPFNSYPEWGSGHIPPRYLPRAIERTLIPSEQFEALYNREASKEAGTPEPFQKSFTHALQGIRLDVMPGTVNRQNLITIPERWVPSVSAAQQSGEPATKPRFVINAGMIQLGERNRIWLKDPKSPFGKMTDMSIREFVNADNDPAEKSKREDQFIAAYNAMLGLSKPLIKLNQEAMKFVSNVDEGKPAKGTLTESSKIPFALDSRIGQKCLEILGALGVEVSEENFEKKWFEPTSNENKMYSSSTSQASLPAWAFESLTGPIATQVANAKNDMGMWVQFWDGRRTRPLTEAAPIPPQMRKSMITGWFVSRMFNITEIQNLPVGRSARIWNPTLQTPGWSQFPQPLLAGHLQDNNREWVLPSILTSIGLAMVELGQSGSLEPLHPYQLLKFIGREVTASPAVSKDNWDGDGMGDTLPNGNAGKSTFILDWIQNGKAPSDSIIPIELFGAASMSPTERKECIIAGLEKLNSQYSDVWNELANADWADIPHMWELKEEISDAIHDIRQYVSSVGTGGSTPTI